MGKTPYELRMEAIQTAQMHLNNDFQQKWEKARIIAEHEGKMLTEVPEYPTTEQILAEATKLKKFIDEA